MHTKKILRTSLILLVLLINVGCDQISKIAVRQSIGDNQQISLIKNHLILTKVENSGAFLSLGDQLPVVVKFILLLLMPLMVLIYGVIFILSKPNLPKITEAGCCFVIGGGMGNIYDRFMYGSVTDFLHIDLVIFRTGIFNLADVSIMTGLLLVTVDFFLTGNQVTKQKAS